MVGEVLAGLSAFTSMFSIAKSLKDMNDANVRNAAVAELWEQILSAQDRYATAVKTIEELEASLTRFETWEAEQQRSELKDFGGATFAYELKQSEAGKEPLHRICPACFQRREKSILQFHGRNAHQQDMYRCPGCKTEFNFGERQSPRQPRVQHYNPRV